MTPTDKKLRSIKWLREQVPGLTLKAAKECVDHTVLGEHSAADAALQREKVPTEFSSACRTAVHRYLVQDLGLENIDPQPEGRDIWEQVVLQLFGNPHISFSTKEVVEVADYIRSAWVERFGGHKK